MIDIVCVNWNSGVQLRACIDSIVNYGAGIVENIFVVDNGSTDNSIGSIEHFPNITIIAAGENLGFGRACNLGARNAVSDYLLFLNPDAELHSGTLQRSLDYMEDANNANIGICGVKLFEGDEHIARSCARFPTAMSVAANAVGIDRVFSRLGYVMREWDHESNRLVDHVIGAYYFVRRSLFDELQGFDEQFFVYLEDVDFSLRAHNAGWSVAFLADAHAFHAGGGTSDQVKALRLFYSLRSRLLYASKHFSWPGVLAVNLTTLLIEPVVRSMYAILRFSWT
jgi:GT2 family glycosyltransferase